MHSFWVMVHVKSWGSVSGFFFSLCRRNILMGCAVKVSLSTFPVVKIWFCLGKLIHSIFPRVKSSLNFQRFCSLQKRKQTFCQTHRWGNQQNIVLSLSSSCLSTRVFIFPQPEGNTVVTRGGGDACKDRGHVVANKHGDVIFSHVSDQMHFGKTTV